MKGLYRPIAAHLHSFCKGDDFVIWRDAFRWKRYTPEFGPELFKDVDPVLSNHYDGMELEQLAEDFGYQVDWDTNMRHAAIVRMANKL